MNESLPEELLSAYLDGELPSDERSRVEQWLAESPEHRRFYDDLLALRREIQALPAQSLDAGFSDRVLAAIRSRTEPAPQKPPQLEPVAPASIAKPSLGIPAWRWFSAGVAAALAAMLLGMNFAPDAMTQIGLLPQLHEASPDPVPNPMRGMAGPVAPQATEGENMEEIELAAPRGDHENAAGAVASEPQAASPVEKQDANVFAKSTVEKTMQSTRLNNLQPEKKHADEKPADLNSSPIPETSAAFAAGSAPGAPAATFAAPGEGAGGKNELAKGDAERELKREAEASRKSVKQWLDDAVARDDGALLELNLALQAPSTNGLVQLAELQRRRTADKDMQAKAKQATEGEKLLRAADRREHDAADDAGEASTSLEISGSREEVERLLAALGQAQVIDARFIAPPATLAARKAKTDSSNADRVGEAGDGSAAQPSADAVAEAAPAPTAPAEAAATYASRAETLKAFGGAAGKSFKRFAPGAAMRGAADKPGEFGDQAAGGAGSGKDAPQRVRVRLQLVP